MLGRHNALDSLSASVRGGIHASGAVEVCTPSARFDPTVVALLKEHYRRLQAEMESVNSHPKSKRSTDLKIELALDKL